MDAILLTLVSCATLAGIVVAAIRLREAQAKMALLRMARQRARLQRK